MARRRSDDETVGPCDADAIAIEVLAGGDPIVATDLDEAALDPGIASPSGLRHAFSSLRHRDFALFWSAALVSNSGSWMQNITVPYVLFHLTRSTTWLGISAFASFFPALLMGPLAGTLADRCSRRTVLLVTQSAQMVAAFSLWGFWVAGAATPGIILAHLLAGGIASGINIASWQSFVPLLVPPEDMLNAVRLNSMQFTGARAFGPAVGGLVLARFGPSTAFMFNAVTFLLVIGALLAVAPRPTAAVGAGVRWTRQFVEGIGYVARRRALSVAVGMITATALLGSAVVQLAPAIATNEFGVGKAAYGLLVGVFGAGAILGSLIQSSYGDRVSRSAMATMGVAIFSAGVIALGVSPAYGLGLASLFVMGVAYLLVSVSLNTAIQARVAESHRGRVLAIYLMGLMAGVPVGALIEGWIAGRFGIRAVVIAVGALQLAYGAAMVASGRLRALDEDASADDPSDSEHLGGVRSTAPG